MKTEIISHDSTTGKATVKFDHGGVQITQDLDLKLVVPGSIHTFEQMGLEFDESFQLKALDNYTKTVESLIDQGVISNKVEEDIPYTPPPSDEEKEKIIKKNKK